MIYLVGGIFRRTKFQKFEKALEPTNKYIQVPTKGCDKDCTKSRSLRNKVPEKISVTEMPVVNYPGMIQ